MARFSLPRAAVVLLIASLGTHVVSAESGLLTSRPLPKQADARAIAVGDEIRVDQGEPRRVLLPDGSRLYVNQNTRVKLLDDNVLSLERGEVFVDANPTKSKQAAVWRVRVAKREIATETAARFAVHVEEGGASVLVTRGSVQVSGSKQPLRAGQQLSSGQNTPTAARRVSHRLAWTRDLMSADVALIPPSEYAGGSLVAFDSEGQSAKLQMRRFHIDVHIEDGFARTTIDQTYFNQTDGRLEGTFYFPLPPDASLSQLTMYVNGERMDGGMVERDFGRTVYETIVNKQKDPALLEWIDGSTFKMRVFPLEPRQEKRLILSYAQKLPSLYGQSKYRFPSGHSLDTVRDWSFQARIKHGTELAWNSGSHALQAVEDKGDVILSLSEKNVKANRDVLLTLTAKGGATNAEPRFSTTEQDGARYLMLRYRPDLPSQQERERRDWVVMVESSADRDPLLMRTQIEIVRGLLAAAESDDTLTVLAVNNRTYVHQLQPDRLAPPRITQAIEFLENIHLIGALDLGQGFAKAEWYLQHATNPYLVHVGSGVTAMGERGPALLKHLPANARYVGIGVGHRWDRSFMKNAADKTGGYFTQINPDEPLAWRAFELAATLNTPRLLDVSIHAGADEPAWLMTATSLAQGEELCAVARFPNSEKPPENVTVRGVLNGKPFERTFKVKDAAPNAGYLPRTWAKQEIDRLLAEDPKKHKAAIIALSKAMVVMTPFTSLLVLENEEMYQQYKVERSRKDRWALYECPQKIPVVYEPEDGQPGDPKKGIKPSAKVVAKTIVTRRSPELLFLSSPQPARPPMGGYAPDVGMLPVRQYGSPILAQIPALRDHEFLERQLPWDVAPPTTNDPRDPRRYTAGAFQSQFAGGPTGGTRSTNTKFILYAMSDIERFGNAEQMEPTPLLPLRTEVALKRPSLDNMIRRDSPNDSEDSTLYKRPRYSDNANYFADLVAFAPGLNTTTADIRAVLEAESTLKNNKPGTIDDTARALFYKARLQKALNVRIGDQNDPSAYVIRIYEDGSYQYERRLPVGLTETVACDGKQVLHLYRELGLGSRRSVSRFHRLEFARLVPWLLPRPEDYAHGADLKLIDKRTIAVIPHGAETATDADGKPLSYRREHLVFSDKGPLAERLLVEMPAKKVLRRELIGENGDIQVVDGAGKEIAMRKGGLAPAQVKESLPKLKNYVILPLPYRTPEHIAKTLGIEKKGYGDLRFEEGHNLLAAFFAAGDAANTAKVFQECFHQREQRQLGFYVLLAACGHNLDGDHSDLMTEHPNEPLAQYLALHSSPVLRKHATQWAVASNPWGDGWLNRLATAHALYQRWSGGRQPNRTEAQQQAERERALDFVKRNKGSALAWALLGLVQDRVESEEGHGQETVPQRRDQFAVWKALAEAWSWFADAPAFAYHARYENARCLWKAGEAVEASKRFRALYEETFAAKVLPPLDADFRQALLANGDKASEWRDLMRYVAKRLQERKERAAVLVLAGQCWQVGDHALATELLEELLGSVQIDKDYLPLVQAVIEMLLRYGQLEPADQKVKALLRESALEKQPALHRLAMRIAERRDQPARQMRHLERALELEFQQRPEVIDLSQVRYEYRDLLRHYLRLAEAMEALPGGPGLGDFNSTVIQTADRWRALDPQATEPCELAARILRTRNDHDRAWDYLTTPLALRPHEAAPWLDLATTLERHGDLQLADLAYEAAFDAEPTDAQILWDRVQNLRQLGRTQEMQKLLRKLVEEKWQPRFGWIQQQAKWQLGMR